MSMTGENYPNRSDLRDAATRQARFTGQTYGEGAAQMRTTSGSCWCSSYCCARPTDGTTPSTRSATF